MKILSRISILLLVLFVFYACNKDKFYFNRISDKYDVATGLKLPLVKGEANLADLLEGRDSLITYNPDGTIILRIGQDTIKNYGIDEFIDEKITLQDLVDGISVELTLPQGSPVPPVPIPTDTIVPFANTSIYPGIERIEDVNIDSVFLSGGILKLKYNSTNLNVATELIYSSDDIFVDGAELYDTLIIPAGDNDSIAIDLTGARIEFDSNYVSNFSSLEFNYIANLIIPANDQVPGGSELVLTFDLPDLESQYEYIFGDFGAEAMFDFTADEVDTIKLDDLGDIFANFADNSFIKPNSSIIVEYKNSFGVNQTVKGGLDAIYEDKVISIDLVNEVDDYQHIYKPDMYQDGEKHDSIRYRNDAIENFLEIPPPIGFVPYGSLVINELDGTNSKSGSTNYYNFISRDSELSLSLALEIPFELRAYLLYMDTIASPRLGDDFPFELDDIEFVRLHHTFFNEFPFGFDVELFLVDSADLSIIDTIRLNKGNGDFLTPAPTGSDGMVIKENVEEIEGVLELTTDEIVNLLEESESMIVHITFETEDAQVKKVKITTDLSLHFFFGLEFAIKGEGHLGDYSE